MVDFFRDNFNGSGNLSVAHYPETGDWVPNANLAHCVLDGAGQLLLGASAQAFANITPTKPYRIESAVKFTALPVAPSAAMHFEIALENTSGGSVIQFKLWWQAGVWKATMYFFEGSTSSTVFSTEPVVPIALDTTYVLRIEVTTAGVRWVLNGNVLGSTTVVPVQAINRMHIWPEHNAFAGAGTGVVDYISVTDFDPSVDTQYFRDTFTGSGNLTTHKPELGEWFGSGLSGSVLDGAGNLLWGPSMQPFANMAPNPAKPFALESAFKVTALPVPPTFDMHYEMSLSCLPPASSIARIDLRWTTAGWHADIVFHDSATSTFPINITATPVTIPLNTWVVVRIEVDNDGLRFLLGGEVVASTTVVPGEAFNRLTVFIDTHAGTGIGSGLLDYVVLSSFAPVVEPTPDAHFLYMEFVDPVFPAGTWFVEYYPEEGTLTGTAVLLDYDFGTRWFTGPANAAGTASPVVGPAGDLVWVENISRVNPMFFAASDWLYSTKNYWAALEVTLNPVTGGSGFGVAMIYRPNGGTGTGAAGSPFRHNGVLAVFDFFEGVLSCKVDYQFDGETGTSEVYASAPYPNARRAFALRASIEGNILTFFVDGVAVATEDVTDFNPVFGDELANNKWVAFDFPGADAPDSISIDYILIGAGVYDGPGPDPIEPEPTAGFWTAKVNAIEDTVP